MLFKKKDITGDFQVLDAVYIQPVINNPVLLARLHSTGPDLEIQ